MPQGHATCGTVIPLLPADTLGIYIYILHTYRLLLYSRKLSVHMHVKTTRVCVCATPLVVARLLIIFAANLLLCALKGELSIN